MEGGSVTPPSAEPDFIRYADVFEAAFPYYLAIGMPATEYWDGRAELVIGYREAHERKVNHDNYMNWLSGYYFYYALGAMSPALNPMSKNHKPKDYLERPLPITESAKEQEEIAKMEKMATVMMAWAKSFKPKENIEAAEDGECSG